jgi:hypothetical protein
MRSISLAVVVGLGLASFARAEDDAAGKALAQARAELSALEALKARTDEAPAPELTAEQARCRRDFTMDSAIEGVAKQAKAGLLPQDMRYQMIGFHSLCYYQCRAYAARDAGRCAPLNFFKIDSDKGSGDGHMDKGDAACRDHIDDIVVTKAFITRDPALERLCNKNLTERGVEAGTAARVCRAIVEDRDDPPKLCREVREARMKLRLVGADKKCEPLYKGINGDEEACLDLPPESHTYERCFEFAAFHKAWKARDISLCGDHPLCRVMMGGGEDNCAQYSEHMVTMLCGGDDKRGTLKSRLSARRRDIQAELDAAERALPAGDARGAEIKALRERARTLLGA